MNKQLADSLRALHAPQELEKWRWEMRDSNCIVATSIPQEQDNTGDRKITLTKLSKYYIPSTAFLFAIIILAVMGHAIGNEWMTMMAMVGVILYLFLFLEDMRRNTYQRHEEEECCCRSLLYVDIPWGYSGFQPSNLARNTLEVQKLVDVLNESKWMMLHGSTEEDRTLAGSIYDACVEAITTKPSLFPEGKGIHAGFLEKEKTKESFAEILEARDKRLASSLPEFYNAQGHIIQPFITFVKDDGTKSRMELNNSYDFEIVYDPEKKTFTRDDTGEVYSSMRVSPLSSNTEDTSSAKKEHLAPMNNAEGSNQLPPEAQRVLSFYEKLGEENAEIVQLPLAAKRWSELSPMDQSNLTLLMEELSPAVTTVRGATAPGRERFLTKAKDVLDENVAMAERVAQGINDSLDRAQLSSMEISGSFIRSAFSDKLTYSLEEDAQ